MPSPAKSSDGPDPVLVAGEDGVDAGDGGELQRGVLHHRGFRAGVDAGVGEGDHDVGAGFAHLGDPGAGGLDDVAGLDVAVEVAAVPEHDLRRHEADEADLIACGWPAPSVMVRGRMT